ncbi:tyrosine-protein phosphatase [Parahaliea mediterranea]|uniref:tyrosine-protein phosphatase n=1 Tax=Parahaliea mediterranea TaxID=651086 RepID=UPI0013007274|nr:tyrosine-protein phosphatase [Parahaliea mediterranea]
MKSGLWKWALAVVIAGIAIVQFIPPAPVAIPAELPAPERPAHRLLAFEGIDNFRDLGGYRTADGRQVRWGVLYRAGDLSQASRFDLKQLQRLQLQTLVDFRSQIEKDAAPDRLPDNPAFAVLAIPTLDDGNSAMVEEVKARFESGDFEGFDPSALMTEANRQFANEFTPQFRQFIHTVRDAGGEPVLWHCTAGKDRTGFAAAILLQILGVPRDTIIQDYLLSNAISLEAHSRDLMLARLFKGEQAAGQIAIMMGVQQPWIEAAFASIDEHWGDFDTYVREGLKLSDADVNALQAGLLQ